MYKSSQLIKTMTTSKGKQVAIEYITKTDAWERKFIAGSRQAEFAAVAEKYKETLKPETVKVAMKEAEHPSTNDPTEHFSALELDKDNNVIASKHYYKLSEATTADIFFKASDAIDGVLTDTRYRENYTPAVWLTKLLEELALLRTPETHPIGDVENGEEYRDQFLDKMRENFFGRNYQFVKFTFKHRKLGGMVWKYWGPKNERRREEKEGVEE